ncbi:MAG: DUF6505 family protein [Alphaproteobacteria bacterium]
MTSLAGQVGPENMMRFPRTIRLDESDTRVFERPAAAGEWAIPGTFVFADADPATLSGKALQAFAHGFLGLESFGWSTLVEVAEISAQAYETTVNALASHFVAHFGAPNLEAALPAARAETEFAASLCEYKTHTLLAMERSFGEEGITERFKVIRAPAEPQAPEAWTIPEKGG